MEHTTVRKDGVKIVRSPEYFIEIFVEKYGNRTLYSVPISIFYLKYIIGKSKISNDRTVAIWYIYPKH